MKKVLFWVVLFLVAGITTFGQTSIITDEDGVIQSIQAQDTLSQGDTTAYFVSIPIPKPKLSPLGYQWESSTWVLDVKSSIWETLFVFIVALLLCYIAGRYEKHANNRLIRFLYMVGLGIIFGLGFGLGAAINITIIIVIEITIGVVLVIKDKTLLKLGFLGILILEIFTGILLGLKILFNQWQFMLIGSLLAVVGYLVGYYTTKQKAVK
jgi:hypothetical protein